MDTKRFNSPQYKTKIHAVRSYKRMARPAPRSAGNKFLAAIGLGSIVRQIAVLLVLAAVIYLIYFAQFLRIKAFNVTGADQQTQQEISGYFNSYLNSSRSILPQKNILFFSDKKFSEYLLANEFKISAVKSIQRKLFYSVNIQVVQRVPEYTLQSAQNFYYLNSDGYLSTQLAAADPHYPLITDTASEQLNPGQQIFNQQKLDSLQYLKTNFSKILPVLIKSFEFPGLATDSIYVDDQQGTQFRFDSTADLQTSLTNLLTLWNSLSPAQQANLAYVDLRFDPKAYVCYKASACAQPQTAPLTTPAAAPAGSTNNINAQKPNG